MDIQTKQLPKEAHSQESGWTKTENQDAVIQAKNSPSGNCIDEEINRLKSLLDVERARFNEEKQRANSLEKELPDTKLQLQKSNEFNKTHVDTGNETKRGLQESGDTFSSNEESEQVKSYEGREALLQRELEQIKVLHQEITTKLQLDVLTLRDQVETLENDLKMERKANSHPALNFFFKNQNKAQCEELKQEITLLRKTSKEAEMHLQEELKQMRISYQELNTRYQTDVEAVILHAETLDQELNDNKEAHSQMIKMNNMLFVDLETEKGVLHEKLASLQNAYKETETNLQRDLDQLKGVHLEIMGKHEADISNFMKQVDTLEQELKDERYAHAETDIRAINDIKRLKAEKKMLLRDMEKLKNTIYENQLKFKQELDALKLENEKQIARNHQFSDELKERDKKTVEHEEAIQQVQKKKSLFKKVRHALGLRKPDKWKKNKATHNGKTFTPPKNVNTFYSKG
ncbi:hypothetical protein GOODEAATRI_030111 [Goodea atripinnis]|uniref:Uncharacterized protein n=1 Tax=Goodea atripinnis TaxID=208336 RepID=A0ABV0N5E8_9TELE